jgi:hypothetical protein
MKTRITLIRKKIAAGLIAFASVFAVAIARFEQDPQSCGMITLQLKKKSTHPEKL